MDSGDREVIRIVRHTTVQTNSFQETSIDIHDDSARNTVAPVMTPCLSGLYLAPPQLTTAMRACLRDI